MRTATVTYAAFPALEQRDEPFTGRHWANYAMWAAFLTPFAVPAGFGQVAFVDLVNAVALVAFIAVVATRGVAVTLPFALPTLLIAAGTLLSLTGAVSLGASGLAIAQDVYLYLWLVVLVAILARPGATELVARVWVLAAVLVAAICFSEAIRARGPAGLFSLDEDLRTQASFYNPNMCADYLVLSLFVLLSLAGSVRRRWLLGAGGAIALALVTTKSNGGLASLGAGALAALAAWAWAGARGRARRIGALAAAAGVLVVAAFALDEARVTDRFVRAVSEQSFVGRLEKSTASRTTIWGELETRLASHPLGIGPGNSALQPVSIGHRVRKDSFQSKEAHSDYVAFLVERGPIAFAGLLLATVQALLLVLYASRRANERANQKSHGLMPASEGAIALWTAACIGGLVATSVHSLVIEKLHFRHFWLFLAWVVASAAWMLSERRARAARASVEA